MSAAKSITASAASEAAEKAAALLARDGRVRLAYLFGSAADPSRASVQDVDVAVLTDPPLSLEEILDLRADLVAATGVDVDLVALNEASIVLAHEIADTGRCLVAAPPEAETDFVVRARARYFDWQHFRDEQWRCVGERLTEPRRGA